MPAGLGGFLRAQKTILKRKGYFALFLLSTLFFAGVFIFLTSTPGQSFQGWLYNVTSITKAFVFLAVPLLALVLTTQVFVLKNYGWSFHEAKAGGSAVSAFLAGVLATACCSPFVPAALVLAGFFGAGFFFIQYQLEISSIAIVVLSFSLYYSSKIIYCRECQVRLKAFKRS